MPRAIIANNADWRRVVHTHNPRLKAMTFLFGWTMSSAVNYVPGRRDPLYDWWCNIVSPSTN